MYFLLCVYTWMSFNILKKTVTFSCFSFWKHQVSKTCYILNIKYYIILYYIILNIILILYYILYIKFRSLFMLCVQKENVWKNERSICLHMFIGFLNICLYMSSHWVLNLVMDFLWKLKHLYQTVFGKSK